MYIYIFKKNNLFFYNFLYRDSNLESNIMQTKQLYINDNIKVNHKDGIQNSNTKKISHLNSNEPIVNKLRYNGNKNDKQFLELKSISKYLFYLI